jgi:hypothetical protein
MLLRVLTSLTRCLALEFDSVALLNTADHINLSPAVHPTNLPMDMIFKFIMTKTKLMHVKMLRRSVYANSGAFTTKAVHRSSNCDFGPFFPYWDTQTQKN